MSKTAEQIAKELHDHHNMKVWKVDDKGIHMVNRQTDSVSNGGITISAKTGITSTK